MEYHNFEHLHMDVLCECVPVCGRRVEQNLLLIINHFTSDHALDLKLMRVLSFAKRTEECNKNEKTNKEKDIERASREQAKISIDLRKRKRSVVENIY